MAKWYDPRTWFAPKPAPTPPKVNPNTGDSSSIYSGSQPAPNVSAPTGAPPEVGTKPSSGGDSSKIQGGGGGKSSGGGGTTGVNQMITVTDSAKTTIDNQLVAPLEVNQADLKKVDTSLMTLGQKAKYYYEQADIAVGGYLPTGITPAQATARNNAQRNADQYNELLKQDITKVVGLAVGNGKDYLSWGGNKYNPKVVQKVLEVQILEKLENNYKNEVIPKIESEKASYNSNVRVLQDKIDSGEITYEEALKRNDELYNAYENRVKEFDKDWQEGKGKQLLEGYSDIARKVGITQNLKSTFSAGKVAVLAGTSAVAGAGLVRLNALGKGAGITSGASIFGKTALAIGAGTSLFNLGSTAVERGKLDKYDVAGALLPIVGYSVIGFASGFAGAKIASANQRTALIAKANVKANAFQKELNKSTNLEKYFTKENIKRGYIERTIDGVKYQFKISERARLNLLAQREGVSIKTEVLTGGVEVKGALKNELIAKLNVDKTATVSKINQAQYTKITGQQVGKNVELYSVTEGSSTNRVGYIVQIDKAGNIKNAFAIRQTINPTEATSIIETAKINLKPNVAMKGGLKFEGITIEGKPRLFVTKAEQVSVQNIGDKGTRIETRLFSKEVKGGDIIRGRTTEIFGKRNELVSEWFARKPVYKVDTTKLFPEIRTGVSVKVTSTRDIMGFKRDLFIERATTTTTKTTPPLFDVKNVRPSKPWNLNQPTGATGSGSGSQSLVESLQRTVGMVAPTPKLTPARNIFPTIVQAGGGGKSLFLGQTNVANLGFSSSINILNPRPDGKLVYDTIFPPTEGLIKRGLWNSPIIDLKSKTTKSPPILKFGSPTIQKTRVEQVVTPAILPNQGLIQKPTLIPVLERPLPPRPIPQNRPIFDKPFGFGLPTLPNLGKIEVGGGQRVAGQRTGLFGKTKYNPSLGSVLTRAKAKKVTEKEFIALTNKKYKGLGLRPIIKVIKD